MFGKLFNFLTKSSATSAAYLLDAGHVQPTPFDQGKNQREGYTQNVIVYRCVNLIASQVSKIPFVLYKGDRIIESHDLLDLLRAPNPKQSQKEFIEDVISQKLITGNAYIEMATPNNSSELLFKKPSYLYSLNPSYMAIVPGTNGMPSRYEFTRGLKPIPFPVTMTGQSNIIHLKEFNPIDDWYGLSPIQPAGINIDQVNSGNKWNYSNLKNGAKISGILKTKKSLTDEQYNRLKKYKEETLQGERNTGEIPILEGDLDFIPNSMSPTDIDFIDGIKMSSQMIAYAFGVPYDLVNTEQAKYDNLDRAFELLWDQAVKPNLIHLLDELNKGLVSRYGSDLWLSYDEDSVEAISTKRSRKRDSLERCSFLTANEKRESLGLDPIDGGDELLTELNKIPLSQVGFSFNNNQDAPSGDKKSYEEKLLKQGYEKEMALKLSSIVYESDDVDS